MSNIDRERNPDNLSQVLYFALREWAKNYLHVSMPGIIASYNHETKRAIVRPGLRIMFTDDTCAERPTLLNVPVLWHSGGGFSAIFPLNEGDPVHLLWSERGIEKWKQSHDLADPDNGVIFGQNDVVALPGYGPIEINPATTSGASIQRNDGEVFLRLEDDRVHAKSKDKASLQVHEDHILAEFGNNLIRINDDRTEVIAGNNRIIVRSNSIVIRNGEDCIDLSSGGMHIETSGPVNIRSSELTHNGVNIGATHTHGGVDTGGGRTSTPS